MAGVATVAMTRCERKGETWGCKQQSAARSNELVLRLTASLPVTPPKNFSPVSW